MRRRGGGGSGGGHRYHGQRNEGRNSHDYGRSAEGYDGGGPSSSNSYRGEGGGERRRGRGRPHGLRGKDIGLYYRDKMRRRQTQESKQHIGVSLDPRKEQQIWDLLESIHDDELQMIFEEKKFSSKRCFASFISDNEHSEGARLDGNQKIDSRIKVELETSDIKEPRTSDTEVEPGTSDFKVEPGTSDSKVEMGTSSRTNRSHSFENKYSHIEDSSFKRKFLQNITGNIETNLERSLLVRTILDRDEELDKLYKEELLSKANNTHYQKMLKFRQKLPSFNKQDEILNLLEHNQIVVIRCGKTTQVAQFILDDYIMKDKGSTCHVVCTQPRRISATSVAARVADERAEVCGGSSVGYQIRLDRELPRRKGSILYCTTGILLQRMESDPALREISHLVLDEIHERDVTCDFLLTILKDVIPKRPDLKLVLMSATLNAEQFAKYYGNCPCINIPGFTYPVKEYYLEDVLEMTRFVIKPAPETNAKWKKFTKFGKIKARKVEAYRDFIEPYIRNLAHEDKYSESVLEMLKRPESEDINLELIAALIHYICMNKGDGAILVFLPGWDNISSLHKLLTQQGRFPSCVRKIVIATNIAETSITIDDVVYVIDCGKIKMKNFDIENNVSTLQAEWPGECYHLYTRAREMILEDYPLPEMLRSRLEEVILQLKILQLGKTKPFLARVMDPPDPRAVELSIKLLENLNAVDADENLTPLGFHLARLPLDPQTGKMILMGALFSCGREEEVNRKKLELSMGQKSDHLVLAEALRQWELADDMRRGHEFCWEFFLSSNTLSLLRSVKKTKNHVIVKLYTPEDGNVCIHPRSINDKQTEFESPFLLYHLKLKSSSIYLHDTTMVYPFPLLFFGKGINVCSEDGLKMIAVDKSIRFRCEETTAVLVKELRKRLDQLLEYKITHPGTINWNRNSPEGAVLRAIIELITSEDKTMMLVAQDALSD
ncbi:ATP-dependent RNA helicase DHX36 [Blattella germanica]|nr:ATP-dependent RNA helicase DHX36 [Blattella germanica]